MSVRKLPSGKYQARYRDATGKEHAKNTTRRADAVRWDTEQMSRVNRGDWIDPAGPKTRFAKYATGWSAAQLHHSPGTAERVEIALRVHILPTFGERPIGSIGRADMQSFVNVLASKLAPTTTELVFNILRMVLRAAVLDRVIPESPCLKVRLPKVVRTPIVPMSVDQVESVIAAMPERWQTVAVLGASAGVREGEALGLTVPKVDFLRRQLIVDEQMFTPKQGDPYLKALKTEASPRRVPLPDVALVALSEHLRHWPADNVDRLLFPHPTNGHGMKRQRFIDIWRRAVRKGGLPAGTRFHHLRHFYASLLIQHGESDKVVQSRLGHKSALETLDTYGHLWPDSEDSTRSAVDGVLGRALRPDASSTSCGLIAD